MNNNRLLSDMMVFAEVAIARSYTQAAKNLGLSKSAVSQQVKRLEVELDEQLLIRNTRGMTLTASGEALYRRCEIVRDQLDLAKKEIASAKQEPAGKFAITCPISAEKHIVIPALKRLCLEYPKLEPSVEATDKVMDLVQQGLDVAIYNGPLKDSQYRALPIGENSEAFYASKEYLLKHGQPNSIDELDKHQWVTLPWHEKGITIESQALTKPLRCELPASVKANNLFGALDMVIAGLGMGFLPSIVASPAIQKGELAQILPDYHGTARQYYLIHRYPWAKPPHLERFYQLVKHYFGLLG